MSERETAARTALRAMADHGEVVERLAKATGLSRLAIQAILERLRPGDDLGYHLWAAPEEPTEAMVVAGCRHENMGDMAGRYKAMRHAAGGEDG